MVKEPSESVRNEDVHKSFSNFFWHFFRDRGITCLAWNIEELDELSVCYDCAALFLEDLVMHS